MKSRKVIALFFFCVLLSSLSFSLSPITVKVINITDSTVALNYKYNGEWAYQYTESLWDMLSTGIKDVEWLQIPAGATVNLLVDRGDIFRIIIQNNYNHLWYTHLQWSIPAVLWEGQTIKIR